MPDPLLSILVPTLPRRLPYFLPRLLSQLLPQIDAAPAGSVELLGLLDHKFHSVGAKRNHLLDLAAGRYLAFIDDDDRIADDYIASLLGVIQSPAAQDVATAPNCIVFDTIVTRSGRHPKLCKYGVELEYDESIPDLWTGKPAHTMCWRSEIAKRHRFPEKSFEEDTDWVSRAWPDIGGVDRQFRIDKTLYFYDFNRGTSETRGSRRRSPPMMRSNNPASTSRDLMACIAAATKDCRSILEFGCMFGDKLAAAGPQQAFRVGVDAHLPYLERAKSQYPSIAFLHGNAMRVANQIGDESFDAVLMVDFIEHLSIDNAHWLLAQAQRIAKQRIVAFVPYGDHPQTKDYFKMGGDEWQTHRSTWRDNDLKSLGFDVVVWEHYHKEKGKDHRCMFAIWEPGGCLGIEN